MLHRASLWLPVVFDVIRYFFLQKRTSLVGREILVVPVLTKHTDPVDCECSTSRQDCPQRIHSLLHGLLDLLHAFLQLVEEVNRIVHLGSAGLSNFLSWLNERGEVGLVVVWCSSQRAPKCQTDLLLPTSYTHRSSTGWVRISRSLLTTRLLRSWIFLRIRSPSTEHSQKKQDKCQPSRKHSSESISALTGECCSNLADCNRVIIHFKFALLHVSLPNGFSSSFA